MKICLVSTDVLGFVKNGGVGTATCHLAELLVNQGHRVDILYTGIYLENSLESKIAILEYKNKGITILPIISPNIIIEHSLYHPTLSYFVFMELKNSNYDQIFFSDMHGLGYYCTNAKKNRTHFLDTTLSILFHGPSEWHLSNNKGLPTTLVELATFFTEKKSCELADSIIFATNHSYNVALDLKYILPENKNIEILLYPFEIPKKIKSVNENIKAKELCFFGRLETRKGADIFLNSILNIKDFLEERNIVITLLGSEGYIQSQQALRYLEKWSIDQKISLNVISNLNKKEAISYLIKKDAIAILASQEETMGFTLVECLAYNIPFISSDISPFMEIINQTAPRNFNTFQSNNHKELALKIKEVLSKNMAPPDCCSDFSFVTEKWNNLLVNNQKHSNKTPLQEPNNILKLSVGIIFFDRPVYLSQLIHSLSFIESHIDEIVILVNKSELLESQNLLKLLIKNKKIKLIESYNNLNPGHARNIIAENINSENILFIDDDNILNTVTFKKFINALNYKWDVVISPLSKFDDNKLKINIEDLNPTELQFYLDNKVASLWIPLGDDIALSLMDNLIGDANFLIKKKVLIEAGGFNQDLRFGEDQDLLIRLILSEKKYVLSSEPFIFYRVHGTNLVKENNIYQNQIIVMNEIAKNKSLSPLKHLLSMVKAWSMERDRNQHHVYINKLRANFLNSKSFGKTNPSDIMKLNNLVKNELLISDEIISLKLPVGPIDEEADTKVDIDETIYTLSVYIEDDAIIYLGHHRHLLPKGFSKLRIKLSNLNKKIIFTDDKEKLMHIFGVQ